MANERWTISGLLMDDWDCANCHRHFDGGGVVAPESPPLTSSTPRNSKNYAGGIPSQTSC
jgi:hypothetical protein